MGADLWMRIGCLPAARAWRDGAAGPVPHRSDAAGRCATALRCSQPAGSAQTRFAQTMRGPFSAGCCAARPRQFAVRHRPCHAVGTWAGRGGGFNAPSVLCVDAACASSARGPQSRFAPRSLSKGSARSARQRRREAQGDRPARAKSRVLRHLTHRVCPSGMNAVNAASYAMGRPSEHRRAAAQRPAMSGDVRAALRQAAPAESCLHLASHPGAPTC